MGKANMYRGIGKPRRSDDDADIIYDQLDDIVFSPPPNFLFGVLTSLLGGGAGVLSLLIFFSLRNPVETAAPDLLLGIALGAAAGYFIRFEQPFIRALAIWEISRNQ